MSAHGVGGAGGERAFGESRGSSEVVWMCRGAWWQAWSPLNLSFSNCQAIDRVLEC